MSAELDPDLVIVVVREVRVEQYVSVALLTVLLYDTRWCSLCCLASAFLTNGRFSHYGEY